MRARRAGMTRLPKRAAGFAPSVAANCFGTEKERIFQFLLGCIDGATGVRMAEHIFFANKGDYYEIADGLPQAPAEDSVLTTRVDSAEGNP